MADVSAKAPLTVRQLVGLLAGVPDFDAKVEIVVDGVALHIVGATVAGPDDQRVTAQGEPK